MSIERSSVLKIFNFKLWFDNTWIMIFIFMEIKIPDILCSALGKLLIVKTIRFVKSDKS